MTGERKGKDWAEDRRLTSVNQRLKELEDAVQDLRNIVAQLDDEIEAVKGVLNEE